MTEIRCPMCGKPNPENLAVCQFCEARLKPLTPTQPIEEKQVDHPADSPQNIDPERSEGRDDTSNDQDWLQRMRLESNIENSPFSETEPESPRGDSDELAADDDDWLHRIQALHQADQETGAKSTSGDEIPKVAPFDPSRDDEGLESDPTALPDWFYQHQNGQSTEDDDTQEEFTSNREELPDWLKRAVSQNDEDELHTKMQPPSQEEHKDAQDWLSEKAGSGPDQGSIFQNLEQEIPDWLSGLGIGSNTTDEVTQTPEPDWLSRSAEEETTTASPLQSKDEDLSDWPSEDETDDLDRDQDDGIRFGRVQSTDSLDDPDSLEPIEPPIYHRPGDQLPDWLRDSTTEAETEKTTVSEGSSPAGEEDLQNWLAELDKIDETESRPEIGETTEDMPGWLKNLSSVVTGTVEDDSLPDLISEDAIPFVGQDELDEDLLDVESLPAWLTPESLPPEEELGEDSGLTMAELPGWLEAMRPVEQESSGISFENGPIESAGPLAGLRAVLPAEPEISHYKKPPVYVAKLRVTDSQLAQADIIRKLVSQEGDTVPIPETPLVSPQRALRWLTAIILFIVIGLVVISGSQFVPLPHRSAIPAATYNSSRIISTLPDQASVLLAFDYEPSTAGEMHAAAAAMVDHLMLKAARLTLVSTLPSGPALAEYFMQAVQSQHNYTSGLQYINLGYIPGGATGLLSFSQTPQWIFPQSYDGLSPWDMQPLQGITSISDFNLVIVITDDPDTARSWIEQVQPGMGETPLLMVTSARAEPLVRPYYGTQPDSQVNGIVSGLSGGAAYEVLVGRGNLGRTYWDAFSVGLLMAVCAILIGGIASVAKKGLAQRDKNFKGED